MYGDPIKSTGGRAFEHSASLRIKVHKASQLKQKSDVTGKDEYHGHIMRLETKKSKMSRPNQKAEGYLLSEWEVDNNGKIETLNGLDPYFTIYQEAVTTGLISKGAWRNYITLNGEEIKLRDAEWVPRLMNDHELYLELFVRTYEKNLPNGFSPLNNEVIDITKLEEFKALEDYYESLPKEENEKEKETGN